MICKRYNCNNFQQSATTDEPKSIYSVLGAGSDHATFIYLTGIPVIDIMFGPDRKKYPKISGYPTYHTGILGTLPCYSLGAQIPPLPFFYFSFSTLNSSPCRVAPTLRGPN